MFELRAADPLVLFISTQPAGAVCHHALMFICCFVCLCVILKDPEQRKQHTEDAGKWVHVISLAERLVVLASRRMCVCVPCFTSCRSTEFLDQANLILSIASQNRANFRKCH